MFDIVSFLAALAFAAYAQNRGRSYKWGVLPFLLAAAMQLYTETGGDGPGELMRNVYAFSITGLLYFYFGQARIAAEREKSKED